MKNCQICGMLIDESENLCERCKVSLFQLFEILDIYIKEDPPPNWLIRAIRELSWIFREYPRTQGYFNTAMEALEMFIIDGMDKIKIEDITEINQTTLPRDKVLNLLEKALIIERDNEEILPGTLTKKIQRIRWEGYEMGTSQIETKLLEVHGVLTVALSKSLIENNDYIPRRALGIFHLLSEQMMASEEDIDPIIPKYVFDLAFRNIDHRQQHRIKRIMAGFLDGHTKIISDITEDGRASMKDVIVDYCKIMRERYRERERGRSR